MYSAADHLPSAAKILQPLDQHVVAKEGLIISNQGFSSRSSQLYEARTILNLFVLSSIFFFLAIVNLLRNSDRETNEVFSRGQNPQHWHVAKRGFGVASDNTVTDPREVYLEVFKKESSLADVDNVLVGIVRKSDL